jgi:hypothetical protein
MTKPLQTLTLPAAALVVTLLAGCVTINIYFPTSAAEKAADAIIDEVWKMKGQPAATVPSAPSAPKEKSP